MEWWWRWMSRIRDIVARRRLDAEAVEEMQFHVDMETRALVQAGLDPKEARRQALVRFGGQDRYREEVARTRFGARVEDVFRDVRHAMRGLARNPGFAATAILTLALGIGANTALFSAVHSVLLRPLPYDNAEDIYRIRAAYGGSDNGRLSPAEYLDLRERLEEGAAVGAYSFGAMTLTGEGAPQLVRAAFVTAGTFPALGLTPTLGRPFSSEEDEGGAAVVLVAESFWQTRLGADPNVLQRSVVLNGIDQRILGVVPDSLGMPEDLLSGQAVQIFAPHGIEPADVTNRGSHYLEAVVRADAGTPAQAVLESVPALGRWMVDTYPDGYPQGMDFSMRAIPLADDVRGPVRGPLLIMSAAVLLVLLIASANVTNLMLARTDRRRREFSVRAALGAGRGRLARQALIESLVLAVLGGLVGLAAAAVVLPAVLTQVGADIAWLQNVSLQWQVIGVGFLLAIAAGALVSVAPALQASTGDPGVVLSGSSRGASGDTGAKRLRRFLIVGQLGLSLVLLSAGGLMLHSFRSLLRVDPGFQTEQILTTRVALPSASYPNADARVQFFQQLVPRLEQIPGVLHASGVTNLPLATSLGDLNFEIEGQPVPDNVASPKADWQAVTPGYFEAMGIEVLQGRALDETDVEGAPGAVVINERVAELHWPGESPLGRRFLLGGGAGPGWVSVVGVVRDVRHAGLERSQPPTQMYLPHAQFRFWGSSAAVPSLALVLRHDGRGGTTPEAVRGAIAELDPMLPLPTMRDMADVRRASLALPRVLTALTTVFALIAILLAAVGLYGRRVLLPWAAVSGVRDSECPGREPKSCTHPSAWRRRAAHRRWTRAGCRRIVDRRTFPFTFPVLRRRKLLVGPCRRRVVPVCRLDPGHGRSGGASPARESRGGARHRLGQLGCGQDGPTPPFRSGTQDGRHAACGI